MSDLGAVILAGGEGRRLGRDKATLVVRGLPLAARVHRALAPAGAPVELQGRPSPAPLSGPAWPDTRPGAGPLAGVADALHRAAGEGREGMVVAAVDLPRLVAPVVLELVRRWRALEAPGESLLVIRDAHGRHPLLAVAGTELAGPLARLVDREGIRSVHAAVEALGPRVRSVPAAELVALAGDPHLFLNVNTPGDVALLEGLPPTAPPLVSVTGWKDSGKTAVAVSLVRALREWGLRVAALKHGHGFRLDTEGTDSHRLRHQGGAETVVLAGPGGYAAFGDWPDGPEARTDGEPGPLALAARFCAGADVVVAEGWKEWPLPAVEVTGPGPAGDQGGDARPPLWRPGAPDRDRFLARIRRDAGGAGFAPGAGAQDVASRPVEIPADAADLGDVLAELVLRRLLPDLHLQGDGRPVAGGAPRP